MARKRAGDLLNILSDPGNREGLVSGPSLVSVTPRASTVPFPGIVGLGAVTGTGVPPVRRRSAPMEDEDRAPRSWRLDLALAGLLGLLVTNIVSFTLGARAGRQSVDPAALTTLQAGGPATTVVQVATPEPAAVALERPPLAPPAMPGPSETGPMLGGVANATTEPTPTTPAPAPAVVADDDMVGKYVVRCIQLPYDARGKQVAAKLCAFFEAEGFTPAIARAVGERSGQGRAGLVVEVGKFVRFDDAKAAEAKVRKLRHGYNSFGDAYVVQRTGK